MKLTRIVRTLLLVAAACINFNAAAHGSLSMEEDLCKLRFSPEFVMHFVGYQPTFSGPEEFCEDIPNIGRTIIVLDFLQEKLRDIPVEVRIVADVGNADNQALEKNTVLFKEAQLYDTGSLSLEHNFTGEGNFIGLVTLKSSPEIVAKFPFSVGKSDSIWAWLIPIVLILLGSFLVYKLAMSRHEKSNTQKS
jgi:hypothetical protein